MANFICTTCGVQYGRSSKAPEKCFICTEERQYVDPDGQSWTTLEEMIQSGKYSNRLTSEQAGLYSITTTPGFGIGQTAYIVQGKSFKLLWDCITFLDSETIERIKNLGGINAIALSHPHYYSTQIEWAEAFDATVYIHEDDKKWVARQSDKIIFWSGDSLELAEEMFLHRLGGHFKGGTVLEWKDEGAQKGVLLTGDIVRVAADRNWVSFMYSYPNFIPLPAAAVQKIAGRLSEINFDRIYDAFHRIIKEGADVKSQKSANRYVDALNGDLFDT